MKKTIELGEKGTQALVALCAHVIMNGNFARDGQWIAHLLIGALGATKEVKAWIVEDTVDSRNSRKRLAAARALFADLEELHLDKPEPQP